MTFLKGAGAGGGGDVLKKLAAGISGHAIGNQGAEVWIAGAAVKVEPSIISKLSIVVAHGVADAVETRLFRGIAKGAISIVAEEFCFAASVGEAEIIRSDLADALRK